MSSKLFIKEVLNILEKYIDIKRIDIRRLAVQDAFIVTEVCYKEYCQIGSVMRFAPKELILKVSKKSLNSNSNIIFALASEYFNSNSIGHLTVLAAIINAVSRITFNLMKNNYDVLAYNELFNILDYYLKQFKKVHIIGYGGPLMYIVKRKLEDYRQLEVTVTELFPKKNIIVYEGKSLTYYASKYYKLYYAFDPIAMDLISNSDILIITGSAISSNTIDDILSHTHAKVVFIYGPSTIPLCEAYCRLLLNSAIQKVILAPIIYNNVNKAWDIILEFPDTAFEGILEHFGVASRNVIVCKQNQSN